MQNWQYLTDLLELMNRIPKHLEVQAELDEIREFYLENKAKFFR